MGFLDSVTTVVHVTGVCSMVMIQSKIGDRF